MRSGLDAFLKGLGVALARLPGARGTTLDAEELRRSFVATTTDAGATVADEFVALVEAATSAAVGDPERLRNEIERAVERMRLLAGAGDSLDVLPGTPISRRLRDRAREVVDHAPHRLLAALDGGVPDGSSRPLAVFKAMVADADKLRVFSIGYPRILATVVARVGSLLLTDSLTLAEVDAFLAGRRFELSPPATGNGNGDRRPDTGSRAAPSHQPPAEG
jgi:hypothetical protein